MFIEEENKKELLNNIEESLQNLETGYYKDIDLIPCLFIEVASKIGTLQILNIVNEEEQRKYYKRLQIIIDTYIKEFRKLKEGVIND